MVFEYEYAVGTQPCSGCQLTVLHPDSLHPDSFHGDQVCDGGLTLTLTLGVACPVVNIIVPVHFVEFQI